MDELNEETLGMSYHYKMADKKTTILIKRDALFATENIAYEIGHVLGAGQGPDISKYMGSLAPANFSDAVFLCAHFQKIVQIASLSQ